MIRGERAICVDIATIVVYYYLLCQIYHLS